MIKQLLITIVLIIAINISSNGQSITNSPYTRFGIGEINRNGFNNSKAMGGISTGLRVANQINYMNPAAISAQDTMSFIFDVGINSIFKDLKSSSANSSFKNFTFDHLAISFPIQRWWFTSFGVTPYSKIGYNIQQSQSSQINDTINEHYDFYGNGGITQLFLSNSFKITPNLSAGVNINYLFGSLEQYNQSYLEIPASYSTVVKDEISLKKITYDLGLQYYNDFADKYFYVVGVTYSNKTNFNTVKETAVLMTENYSVYGINVIDYFANNSSTYDTIKSSKTEDFKVEIPAKYSIGFTAGIKNKLILGFDYSHQDWSNVNSLNISDNFDVEENFNLGIEYTPEKYSMRNYFKRINYRAGLYLNNSYLKFNDEQIKNYGITFGLGFPISNQRTSLNVSYTYGKRGTTNNGLIQENYSIIGVNLTLYDFWFIKRKIQ